MRFRVGDLIYNKITQEQGHIVRLVEKNNSVFYVVVVPASALRGEKEALWRHYEVDVGRSKREGICGESAVQLNHGPVFFIT